tara:strand:+ start:2079 stop:2873 length:795 start_codon:yes stop_codon:yes gene_type:complete
MLKINALAITCIRNFRTSMRKKSQFITTPSPTNKTQGGELITIVLLAENYGYRMKSKGALSLVEVKGKSLLEIQIQAIRAVFTNFEIILCCGYDSKSVYEFIQKRINNVNIRIVENQVYENSNCCETARIALNNTLNEKIIIMNGGLLISASHLKEIDTQKTCILSQANKKMEDFEIGVVESESRVQNMSLGVKERRWLDLLFLSGKKNVKTFYNIVSSMDFKNRFLFEAINELTQDVCVENVDIRTTRLCKVDSIKSLKRIDT